MAIIDSGVVHEGWVCLKQSRNSSNVPMLHCTEQAMLMATPSATQPLTHLSNSMASLSLSPFSSSPSAPPFWQRRGGGVGLRLNKGFTFIMELGLWGEERICRGRELELGQERVRQRLAKCVSDEQLLRLTWLWHRSEFHITWS